MHFTLKYIELQVLLDTQEYERSRVRRLKGNLEYNVKSPSVWMRSRMTMENVNQNSSTNNEELINNGKYFPGRFVKSDKNYYGNSNRQISIKGSGTNQRGTIYDVMRNGFWDENVMSKKSHQNREVIQRNPKHLNTDRIEVASTNQPFPSRANREVALGRSNKSCQTYITQQFQNTEQDNVVKHDSSYIPYDLEEQRAIVRDLKEADDRHELRLHQLYCQKSRGLGDNESGFTVDVLDVSSIESFNSPDVTVVINRAIKRTSPQKYNDKGWKGQMTVAKTPNKSEITNLPFLHNISD